MSHTSINRRTGLAIGTLSLALLGACGGGGEEPALASVPSAQQASAAAVATRCGIQDMPAQSANGFELSTDQSVLQDGLATLVSTVASLNGHSGTGHTPVRLDVPMKDLREVAFQRYDPSVTPASTDRMGVEAPPVFPPGSVGCVTSVARVVDTGSTHLLSWKGSTLPHIPLDAFGDIEIDGFEYVSNFEATPIHAFFRIQKTRLANPQGVQICHVTSHTDWTCTTPATEEDGASWVFRRPISQSGVYLISAPRESVPVE